MNPLPSSLEIEETILASAMSGYAGKIIRLCKAEFFYDGLNVDIFNTIVSLNKKGYGDKDITPMMIQTESSGRIYQEHGERILGKFSGWNQTEYAIDVFKKIYWRRKLIRAAMIAKAEAEVDDCDCQKTYLELIESAKFNDNASGLVSIKNCLPGVLESLEKYQSGEKSTLKSGFACIDNILGGFDMPQLVILGGRPSSGKTTLALNITQNVIESGIPAYIYSIEMTTDQLIMRYLSSLTGIPVRNMKTSMTKDQFDRLKTAMEKSTEWPVYIYSESEITVNSIASMSTECIEKHGSGLIVVDFIQIVTPEHEKENRVTELSKISTGLLLLAKKTGCCVLCLSQLSREIEKQEREPRLSDLRDCGGIEQDAHVVMILEKSKTEFTRLHILKNRDGDIGVADLKYEKLYSKFVSLEDKKNESPNNG
jgi:replicative DNA helicase